METKAKDLELKERGNALYKQQLFDQAAESYSEGIPFIVSALEDAVSSEQKAALLERRAVLLSNRANCRFELGDYQAASLDSLAALGFLKQSSNDTLKIKNLWRLARSEFFRKGLDALETVQTRLEEIVALSGTHSKKRESNPCSVYAKKATDMLSFLSAMPSKQGEEIPTKDRYQPVLLRSCLMTPVSEHYPFGHDKAESALANNKFGDLLSLRLKELTDNELSSLSFLYGGVGDARHVFVTLMDAHQQFQNELNKHQRDKFRMFITCNDINAQVLAKDVLVLVLSARMGEAAENMQAVLDDPDLFLLGVVTMYVTLGHAMPAFVYERFQQVVREIFGNEQGCSKYPWLRIDKASWDKLVDVTSYWTEEQPYTPSPPSVGQLLSLLTPADLTNRFQKARDSMASYGREDLALERDENAKRRRDEMEEHFRRSPSTWTSQERQFVREHVGQNASDAKMIKEALKMTKQVDVNQLMATDGERANTLRIDKMFHGRTHALLPPIDGRIRELSDPLKSLAEGKDKGLSRAQLSYLIDEYSSTIYTEWKLNPVKLDPYWYKTCGEFTGDNTNPIVEWLDFLYDDAVQDLMFEPPVGDDGIDKRSLLDLNCKMDAQLVHCVTRFYWNVGKALHGLEQHVCIEVDVGGVTDFGARVRKEKDERKKIGLESEYSRISLSNIPDYIGLLSVFAQVAPLLADDCGENVMPVLRSYILFNPNIWGSYDEHVYSTVALSYEETARLLRLCPVEQNPDIWSHWNHWFWSDAVSVSQSEVKTWLERLFLFTVLPPDRDRMTKGPVEQRASTVDLFLSVCAACMDEPLGHAGHWISSVLDSLLAPSGQLKTKATVLNRSPQPLIEVTNKINKYDVSAFRLELSNQLAIWLQQGLFPKPPLITQTLPSGPARCYRLKVPGLGDDPTSNSGNEWLLCLGFLLEKELNPDYSAEFDMSSMMGGMMAMMGTLGGTMPKPTADNSRLRQALLDKGDEVGHLFSCVKWNITERSVTFWMCEDIFERYKAFHFSLLHCYHRLDHDAIRLGDAERM